MVFRCILIVLCIFCLFLPVYAKENLTKMYLSRVEYNGPDSVLNNTIDDVVKDEILSYGMFAVVSTKAEAEYILSCTVDEKSNEMIVSMRITGTLSNSIDERIVKRDTPGVGFPVLLRTLMEYIHEKIFPFEIYAQQNQAFFTAKNMKSLYNKDVIDRTRDTSYKRPLVLFDPLDQKVFDTYRFQLFPSCEFSYPVNLIEKKIYQAPQIQLPLYFYLFNTDLFMIALQAEVNYIPLSRLLPSYKYNRLNIIEFGGGTGICFPLPFYQPLALHLNLSGGSAVSIVTSEELADRIYISWDPYIHPSFEIEHSITRNISFSLKCSYIRIFYIGEDLHLLQTGLGFGFRF